MTDATTANATAITIRPAEPEDHRFLQEIYAQPKAIAGTLQMPYTSIASWRERTAKPRSNLHLLIACVDDTPVGSLGLSVVINPRRRHVGEIGMGVHDRWHGKGVGGALMAAALELADQWLSLHRVELTVFADNEPAIRLYRANGFEVEGTLRDYAYRAGNYVDAYAMARLNASSQLV